MSLVECYINELKKFGVWDNVFTDEDWSYIAEVASKNNFCNYLEHFDLSKSTVNVKLIGELAYCFQYEDDNKYFLLLSTNFECFTKDSKELHFAYQSCIAVYQRNLKYWSNSWEHLKNACHKQISVASEACKLISASHIGYKRLSICLEKEGRYSEVVSVCRLALSQGWTGDWDKRITRNVGRSDSIKEISMPIQQKVTNLESLTKSSSIPEFFSGAPKRAMLSSEQNKFYASLYESLQNDQYIEIDGNCSYVYLYMYELILNGNHKGFDWLSIKLKTLCEVLKQDEKLSSACHWFYLQSLLALKKYEQFLSETEPTDCMKQNVVLANLRLNVQLNIGEVANPMDVVMLFPPRSSDVLNKNKEGYAQALKVEFQKYEKDNMSVFSLFIR